MTEFKPVGPFGIFRQEDILRAIPVESPALSVEVSHSPKSHIEDFEFTIVQKTLIQVELIVKSYDDVETHERFVDTTNDRVAKRVIILKEDEALEFFGFDTASAPPKKSQTEAISKERAKGINVRIWIKRYKAFLQKTAEFDEARAALTVLPTDPTYNEEFGKVLRKQPSEAEAADFQTFIPKILNEMSERLKSEKENNEDELMASLEPRWNKTDGNPVLEARKELLSEYMQTMFSSNNA